MNVHYAPLPRYRGRATVNWAIINGETHAAITIHELVAGLDSGGILFQESVPIGDRDNVTDLYRRLNEIQWPRASARRRAAPGRPAGHPAGRGQGHLSCTRLPSDGEIDWGSSAVDIDRLVRALTDPFPGAFTWIGTRRVTVDRASLRQPRYEGAVPGRVAQVNRDDGSVDVLTGDGLIRILDMRADGRSVRPAEVLNSAVLHAGFFGVLPPVQPHQAVCRGRSELMASGMKLLVYPHIMEIKRKPTQCH